MLKILFFYGDVSRMVLSFRLYLWCYGTYSYINEMASL